jgi:hypothetical protein
MIIANKATSTNHLYEILKFKTTLKKSNTSRTIYSKSDGKRTRDFSKSPCIKYRNDR